jgi:hypothetical protein
VLTALREAPALILILSRALRQSQELFRRITMFYRAMGGPVDVAQESSLQIELANGSRIITLPGNEATIRCYSGVSLLIIDEAARVPDDLYKSVRPMLAVSGGRIIMLSTPFGKQGSFYEAWQAEEERIHDGRSRQWHCITSKATDCPRISRAFLESERTFLGDRWFRQEYECSFESTIDQVFRQEDIDAALGICRGNEAGVIRL